MFQPRHIVRTGFLVLVSLVAAAVWLTPAPASAATCSTSSPASQAYTVTVCFTAPSTGATLTGAQRVTATATVTGTGGTVQRLIFLLDANYLITDFQSTYTFILPTHKYVDGAHTLSVYALMRDGFQTLNTDLPVTFLNGVTSPPVNNAQFTPAPGNPQGAGQPFVVAAGGDGASGERNSSNVTTLIQGWNPNLFLYLGDVYEKGSPVEFYNWYNGTGFFGAFRAITNPTIGNHEYEKGVAPGYFDYWDNPPNYYSFTTGGWHFISLNSNTAFMPASPGSPQYQWLQQDLAANTTACTLVYFHHPVYSTGPQGDTTAMDSAWSLMAQYGVDVVLTGHDHDYQRWVPLDGSGNPSPDGITEFVVGNTGHGLQGFVRSDTRLAKGISNAYGALRLSLTSTGASYAMINTAGTTLDSGSLACHAAPPPPTPTMTPSPTATPAFSATFGSAADAYVDSSNPTINYGTLTSLKMDASPVVNTYIRFNVQGLGGTVTRATLRMFANSSSSTGIDVHGVADNTWGETTVNYGNAPAMGGIVGSTGAITAGTWYSVDVTSLVKGNGLASFGMTTTSSTARTIASREAGSNAPQLIVETSSAPLATNTPTLAPAATNTPTLAPAATNTPTRTPTLTPAVTNTPTVIPNATNTNTPTNTPAPVNTSTPTATATPTSSTGTTTTTLANADSYVDSANPTTNYGTSTSIRLDGSPIVNGYVRFTVQGLSGSVKSATLRIYANSSLSAGVDAHSVADNTWGETTVNYSNAPAMGGAVANSGAITAGTWLSVNVTSLVTGNGTFTFGLTDSSATALNLASRESANPPQLVITSGP